MLIVLMLCLAFSPVQTVQATGAVAEETQEAEDTTTGDSEEEKPEEEQPNEEKPDTDSESEGKEESKKEPEEIFVVSPLSPAAAKVIVIDPGHCARHPGARAGGIKEEVVVTDIAAACQNYLNQYGDVTVYMTRTAKSCPESMGIGSCLYARSNYAKALGADFLVSMHINAGRSSGANVLAAYRSGYHDNIRKETQQFGKIVLRNLKKLGVANRGLLLRRSSQNRYSNGRMADYYAIVRRGVVDNIPGVIIEHGYVTSASDRKKFFSTKAKRTTLGVADAQSILSYYGLSKSVIAGSFVTEGTNTFYKDATGTKVTGWVKVNGDWYYMNESGIRQTGFVTVGENRFYLSPADGKLQTGFIKTAAGTFYAKGNGTLVKNALQSDGVDDYLFDAQGKLLYGNQTWNGKEYFLNISNGKMIKNQIAKIDGESYYFGPDGAKQTGLVNYNKNKYYFDEKNGKMVKGWQKIKGKYYYFSKKNGKMQKKKWIGKYYVNSKGIRTKSKKK